DHNAFKKRLENIEFADSSQVDQRSGIGNDRHGFAGPSRCTVCDSSANSWSLGSYSGRASLASSSRKSRRVRLRICAALLEETAPWRKRLRTRRRGTSRQIPSSLKPSSRKGSGIL